MLGLPQFVRVCTDLRLCKTIALLPATKKEVNAFARVCLSVSKITKNACMDLDEMLRVDRCRDVDELINF